MKKVLFAIFISFFLFWLFSFSSSAQDYIDTDCDYYIFAREPSGQEWITIFDTSSDFLAFGYSPSDYACYVYSYNVKQNAFFSNGTGILNYKTYYRSNTSDSWHYSASPNSAYFGNGFSYYDANVPLFTAPASNYEKYFLENDSSGAIFVPEPTVFNPMDYEYDSSVPTPVISVDKNYNISFANGSSEYGVIAYSRWLSLDDFTFEQTDNIVGIVTTAGGHYQFHADTILSSDLVYSMTVEDNVSSSSYFNIYGQYPELPTWFTNSFDDFLLRYPIENRSFTAPGLGGVWTTRAAQYRDAIKEALSSPNSKLNTPEIYFRFYCLGDNGISFGKWTKFRFELGTSDYSTNTDYTYGTEVNSNTNDYQTSNNGLDNDSIVNDNPYDNSNTVNFRPQSNDVVYNTDRINYTIPLQNMQDLLGLFGSFPLFIRSVYAFLPTWMLTLIGSTITIICGLGIYHGIRG